MLKFKEGQLAQLLEAITDSGVKLNTSPKVTQAIINLAMQSKKLSSVIKLKSTTNGIVLTTAKNFDSKNPVIFSDETMVEFSHEITPDIYHKKNDNKAEFRYFVPLRQVLRVRSQTTSKFFVEDDDGNTFFVPVDFKSISAKQSVIPIFFPNLIENREKAQQIILASNARRSMTGIQVGDTVTVRSYADMVAEFGDTEVSFGYDGETMRITGEIRGADTIVFPNYASHLAGRTYRIAKILEERDEIILTDNITDLINPETSEELPNIDPIRFSKLHFTKAA